MLPVFGKLPNPLAGRFANGDALAVVVVDEDPLFAALLDPNENNGVAVLFVEPVFDDEDDEALTRAENGVAVVNVDDDDDVSEFRVLKMDDEPIVDAVLLGVSEAGLLNENGVDEIVESFLFSFDCSFDFVTLYIYIIFFCLQIKNKDYQLKLKILNLKLEQT